MPREGVLIRCGIGIVIDEIVAAVGTSFSDSLTISIDTTGGVPLHTGKVGMGEVDPGVDHCDESSLRRRGICVENTISDILESPLGLVLSVVGNHELLCLVDVIRLDYLSSSLFGGREFAHRQLFELGF